MTTRLAFMTAVLAAASGCSLKVGTRNGEHSNTALRMRGLVNGYVSVDALRPYDGNILELGVLGASTRHGEIVSVDVWPLVGIGVGVVGVRTRVLVFETGIGVLFYDPKPPPRYVPAREEEDDEVKEDDDDDDDGEAEKGMEKTGGDAPGAEAGSQPQERPAESAEKQ
jgi:hypothetical protein